MKLESPCPFCGEIPELSEWTEYYGTFLDLECCIVSISIQISDLMTLEERKNEPFITLKNPRYSRVYIERAMDEAIRLWETRVKPKEPTDGKKM